MLDSIDYKTYGVTQERDHELQVHKTEEINNAIVKRCGSRVSVFCQVVQKHLLGEVEK